MRIATRRLILRIATIAAMLSAAAAILLPAQAFAATTAYATATVSVREGPSTSWDRIGTLSAGETVRVEGCRDGWCYTSSPERGFVSASYLSTSRSSTVRISPNFNLSFNFPEGSFSIGSGGVSIGIGTPGSGGTGSDAVCFYSGSNYSGSRICLEEGDSIRSLPAAWNDRISSFRNPDGLRVTVCEDRYYSDCRVYTTSARYLGSLSDEISSIRVR